MTDSIFISDPYTYFTIDDSEIKEILDNLQVSFNAVFDNKKPTFVEQLKIDAINASYRVAATQIITATHNLLVQQLLKSGEDESKVKAIGDMLNTDFGKGILQFIIGASLSQVAYTNKSPRILRLMKEFRVNGITTVGNIGFNALISSIMPALNEAFSKIDDVETAEVAEVPLARTLQVGR